MYCSLLYIQRSTSAAMTLTSKSRTLPFGGGFSTTEQWWGDSTNSSSRRNFTRDEFRLEPYAGYQKTDSEDHSWPPPKGQFGDVGGDFYTIKMSGSQPRTRLNYHIVYPVPRWALGDEFHHKVRMSLACPIEASSNRKTVSFPTSQASNESELNARGATAISRCRPTHSAVELSTAVGELLKEGLPSLVGHETWQSRTLAARNAGSEYLNVEFGWKPLISEITNFGGAVINSDSILKQYEADRGKSIRRRYYFPDVRDTETVRLPDRYPDGTSQMGNIDGYLSQPGQWWKTTTTVKRSWFSGAFAYGVPLGSNTKDTSASLAEKADKLFGISLTPDVLWNLSPWSWAVDWVSNTGDVLSTASDMLSQGLVMQYGYIMEETSTFVTYSLQGCRIDGRAVNVPDATLSTVTKCRKRANPFGFGITWDGLSSTQGAILAALGISRS